MGRQLRNGSPLRGSLVWVARHPRDYDLSLALAHIDVSATYLPRPGPPDRQILLTMIVYHYISILVFITDSPGQTMPPQPSPTEWTLAWPSVGNNLAEYPPMNPISGTELTEIFTQVNRWIPLVRVSAIRRSELDPKVRYRN